MSAVIRELGTPPDRARSRHPFRTSFGVETQPAHPARAAEVDVDGVTTEGWGECVAATSRPTPSEYADGAALVMRTVLWPALVAHGRRSHGRRRGAPSCDRFRGHPMAKAALEMAVLDAELRAAGRTCTPISSAATATASRAA